MSPKLLLPLVLLVSLRCFGGDTLVSNPVAVRFAPRETISSWRLGERTIQVKVSYYGAVRDMVYVNLHDDEVTAINGARKLLEQKGGVLIRIDNYRTRNIRFRLKGKYYTIDPNRMFSRKGIAQSLLLLGNTSPEAIDEVDKFANFILRLIPRKPTCVMALHNNGNGRFSINTYLPGGPREKDARTLHVNPEQDADNFFLTTDSVIFRQLSAANYNTILQDNGNAKRDGSLSVYCGEQNMQYINCETEDGQQEEYDAMIGFAVTRVENLVAAFRPDPDAITYSYRILSSGGTFSPKENTDVFFGDRKVGTIRTVNTDSAKVVTGRLDMVNTFPLSSNMDLYVFLQANSAPRFEVRIDPTRQGVLLNPAVNPVSVGIRMTH